MDMLFHEVSMLKKLTAPPKFEDPEQDDTASQLWSVVLGMTTMSVLYVVLWLALVPELSFRIIYALPLFPLYAWLFHLLKKGKVRLAANILVIGIWGILFIAASFSGGVLAPGYSGLLLTVLTAGIFLNRGTALRFAWLSVLGGGALVLLERQGIIPAASQFTDSTTMWIAQAVYFFVAASLLQMATQRIANALQRAERENEQRRGTESQLREAEKRYRELVEKVPAVLYSAEPGPAGRWFYVSPRIEELTGFTYNEWVDDPNLWFSRVHPEDREVFIAGELEALAQNNLFQMEYRFTRKDETVIWLRDESISVTSDQAGGNKVVQGYFVDVTARRQAEEKLRSNEVLLSTIIDTIPFDFWVCDEHDRYILQNPVSRSMAGDLVGRTLDDLEIPADTLEGYRRQHRRVLGGESLRAEETTERNGEPHHALFIAAPIQDRGKNRGFVGMTIDITDQKRTLEALTETELLYRTLVEQSSVALYRDYAEPGGPSIFITDQIEHMIGYSPAEFSSSPKFWHTLIHPEDRAMVTEVIDRIIETGGKITCDYRMRSKQGEWVWLRDEAMSIRDHDGKPLYIQGVYMDITNQKIMEAQRESLIAELEAKNAELERFTYTVSHDLKAPLITMGGFLGYLEKDALSGDIDSLKRDIQRISDANRKMETLLNDLLELSRVGRLINPPEEIPFRQIVDDALSRVTKQMEKNQIHVQVRSDLPTVRGDRIRLVEVMQNLLENAAKFTMEKPHPEVEVGAEIREDGARVFFVRDNGIGIAPEHHAKIFELFHKLNPNQEGTGIGLALVKRIIEVHGGRIWVDSEAGKGTTFYFTLE
jgi:PAS domain S-box-containing protein